MSVKQYYVHSESDGVIDGPFGDLDYSFAYAHGYLVCEEQQDETQMSQLFVTESEGQELNQKAWRIDLLEPPDRTSVGIGHATELTAEEWKELWQ
jgi:hypothetical protein